jgi:cytochrome P450
LEFLAGCADDFGPMVSFVLPRFRIVFVNSATGVQRVLRGNHQNYGKRTPQYRSLASLTGEGIVVSEGDAWKSMRRLLAPSFHRLLVEDIVGYTESASARLVDEWSALPEGSVVDLDEALMRTTLDVIGRTLFGADLTAAAAETVGAVSSALDDVVRRAQGIPLPGWLPTPGNRRFQRDVQHIDDAVGQMVREHRPGADDASVLDALITARDAGAITDQQVRDESVTLVVAGHETVAATVTWTIANVANDDTTQDVVAAEGRALAARATGTSMTDVLAALPVSTAAVEEALRLWPPVWLVTRRALADDVIDGYRIPAGTMVIIALPLVHRDPSVFADPQRFDASRFLPPSRAAIPRDAYLPFGAGPRLCVGNDLAMVEAPILLASLLAQYRVTPLAAPKAHPGATIRPEGGLPCRVERRV